MAPPSGHAVNFIFLSSRFRKESIGPFSPPPLPPPPPRRINSSQGPMGCMEVTDKPTCEEKRIRFSNGIEEKFVFRLDSPFSIFPSPSTAWPWVLSLFYFCGCSLTSESTHQNHLEGLRKQMVGAHPQFLICISLTIGISLY